MEIYAWRKIVLSFVPLYCRRIEKEVKNLQAARADYKYWYYIPTDTKTYEVGQQDSYEAENERGHSV